jgi:hypothetical protein
MQEEILLRASTQAYFGLEQNAFFLEISFCNKKKWELWDEDMRIPFFLGHQS